MDTIYLDNASTTFPKPACVPEAMLRYITGCGSNIARGGYSAAYSAEEMVFETRERICALFGGEDGLDFSRAVITEYKKALKAGGMLAFEVGAGEAAAVEALLEDAGLKEINTEKDLGGICRAVYGIKK